MEEATELFTIMQSMIQAGEVARAALTRVPPPPKPTPPPPPGAPPAPWAGASGDDLLVVGLLAMGAGAGVLAAVSKRSREATSSPETASISGSDTVPPARKG
jgi:hypothetical protein